MKKTHNNHARAKRRIKVLKLKNFCKRVMEKRAEKIARMRKPKGTTIRGRAKEHAVKVVLSRRYLQLRGTKNQRQKRKLWRHAPHMRKGK